MIHERRKKMHELDELDFIKIKIFPENTLARLTENTCGRHI
jgi:hypothetical protein